MHFPGFDAPQIFVGGQAIVYRRFDFPQSAKQLFGILISFTTMRFGPRESTPSNSAVSVERDQLNVSGPLVPAAFFSSITWQNFLGDCGWQAAPTALCQASGACFKGHSKGQHRSSRGDQHRRNLRQTIFGVYFQDDWKVRQNLTINMGLRYEPTTVPVRSQGRNATLPSIYDTTGHQLPICGAQFAGIGPTTCTAQTNGLYQQQLPCTTSIRV